LSRLLERFYRFTSVKLGIDAQLFDLFMVIKDETLHEYLKNVFHSDSKLSRNIAKLDTTYKINTKVVSISTNDETNASKKEWLEFSESNDVSTYNVDAKHEKFVLYEHERIGEIIDKCIE
jgi:hypothetical protein